MDDRYLQKSMEALQASKYEQAMLLAAKHLEINPNELNGMHIWAKAAGFLKLYDEACEMAKNILKRDAYFVGAYIVLSYCAEQQGNLYEKEKWFLLGLKKLQKAPRWKPFACDLYILVASYYADLGENAKARDFYMMAAELKNNIYRANDFSNAVFAMNSLDLPAKEEKRFAKKYRHYLYEPEIACYQSFSCLNTTGGG